MKYSKAITDLCNTYMLTPEEAIYCMLASRGCYDKEAYILSHRPPVDVNSYIQKKLAEMKQKPGIEQCLKTYKNGDALKIKEKKIIDKKLQPKEIADFDITQFEEKSGIIEFVANEMSKLLPKERAELALKLGNFQMLNKEKNEKEENRIHFYLPLTCNKCELYKKNKKTK